MTKLIGELFALDRIDERLPRRLRDHFVEERIHWAQQLCELFRPLFAEGCLEESLDALLQYLRRHRPTESGIAAVGQVQVGCNALLWHGAEEVAALATALFECLYQIDIFHWTSDLQKVVNQTIEVLRDQIKILLGICQQLAETLWLYENNASVDEDPEQWFGLIRPLRRAGIDHQIVTYLEKTQQFLEAQAESYQVRFTDYFTYAERAAEAAAKVEEYCIYHQLSADARAHYRYILNGLSIWESDANASAVLLEELARSLRQDVNAVSAYGLFSDYSTRLQEHLFSTSREMKSVPQPDFKAIHLDLSNVFSEVAALKHTVARYREFVLKTDPDPYVRTRLGFPEWVVGEEPQSCRQLLVLEFQLEAFAGYYKAMVQGCTPQSAQEVIQAANAAKSEVAEALHAVSQPGISELQLRRSVSHLLGTLLLLRELVNTDGSVVALMSKALLKVLCDARCQELLFLDFQFTDLYATHHQLVKPLLTDAAHRRYVDALEKHITAKSTAGIDALARELDAFVNEWLDGHRELSAETIERMVELQYTLGKLYHSLSADPERLEQVKLLFEPIEQNYRMRSR